MTRTRTAVVTGGTRGLGLALVDRLARSGWRVYTMARNQPALARLARHAAHATLPIVPLRGDIAEPAAVGRLVRRLTADRRRVDLLVHNAGLLGVRAPLADWPRRTFEQVMAANVTAPFDLTRRLLPRLREGATIAFVSSGVTHAPREGWGAYEISKVAMERLAQVFALELAERRIASVIIQPGRMRTDMRARAFPDEDPMTLPTPETVAARMLELLAELTPADSGSSLDAGA